MRRVPIDLASDSSGEAEGKRWSVLKRKRRSPSKSREGSAEEPAGNGEETQDPGDSVVLIPLNLFSQSCVCELLTSKYSLFSKNSSQ